jgi:hypothetical protein
MKKKLIYCVALVCLLGGAANAAVTEIWVGITIDMSNWTFVDQPTVTVSPSVTVSPKVTNTYLSTTSSPAEVQTSWTTTPSATNTPCESSKTPTVPAPGVVALAGIGMALVGWFRSRKSL